MARLSTQPLLFAGLLLGTATLALSACESTSTTTGPEISAVMQDDGREPEAADDVAMVETLAPAGAFAVFEPRDETRSVDIDYTVISDALYLMVFDTGPSLRVRARQPQQRVGTRFQRGHDSPYRLEGNKIFFSQFDGETIKAFKEYVDSLVAIGNQVDIASLPRNEQLAYWFNLHNMQVISLIAQAYPTRFPATEKFGPNKETLHEAKLLEVGGVKLSLRDIRENIVYRYWSDPRVMYGFFHGDLGSPTIRKDAFTGDNVVRYLDRNADEFVNALRGVSGGTNKTFISKHYIEARAGLFPNWPSDLLAHLNKFANNEVEEILATGYPLTVMAYPDRTADLVGGDPRADITQGASASILPAQMVELVTEVQQKYVELRRQGRLGARVTIIDIDTTDTGGDDRDQID